MKYYVSLADSGGAPPPYGRGPIICVYAQNAKCANNNSLASLFAIHSTPLFITETCQKHA